VLALGVLGYAISLFMFGVATQFWVLFLARSLSGILSSATMAAAMAYIGDAAPAGDRSSDMGQLGAAMGVGTVVGPLVGGWLSADSLSLPFLVGAGIAYIALLLVLFALPESHKPHGAGSGQAQPGRRALWRTVLGPAGMLLLLICLDSFALTSVQGVTGLYVVDKFDFSTKQVGAVWMVMGGVTILVQGLLAGPLTRRFGELPLIYVGLLGSALGYLAMSLAAGYLTTLLAVGFFTLSLSVMGPPLNAYVSAFAGEHQGTIMGLNSAAASLGKVAGREQVSERKRGRLHTEAALRLLKNVWLRKNMQPVVGITGLHSCTDGPCLQPPPAATSPAWPFLPEPSRERLSRACSRTNRLLRVEPGVRCFPCVRLSRGASS
jgi:DHA1 family multidrug resistance protein-like MFS transporter